MVELISLRVMWPEEERPGDWGERPDTGLYCGTQEVRNCALELKLEERGLVLKLEWALFYIDIEPFYIYKYNSTLSFSSPQATEILQGKSPRGRPNHR